VLSLLHLAIGATVIAFWSSLAGRPHRARRRRLFLGSFPIVALTLSTLFEGYAWTPLALGGVVLVLAGNVLVLIAKRRT